MKQLTTSYDHDTHTTGVIHLDPIKVTEGRFEGRAEFHLPEKFSQTAEYTITTQKGVFVEPIDIVDKTAPVTADLKCRLVGDNPAVVFAPIPESTDLPTYRFELPSLGGVQLCDRFLKEGITELLVEDIQTNYELPCRDALFDLLSDAKCYLTFDQYMTLFKQVAEYDSDVKSGLASSQHRFNFFKNLLRKNKVGEQYPVLSLADFKSRLDSYQSVGLEDQLGPVNGTKVVEKVIEDASAHGAHLGEICDLEEIFVEYAPELKLGHFISLLSEAWLNQAPSGQKEIDAITWATFPTKRAELDPKRLVEQRYSESVIDNTTEQLRNRAYETKDIDLFEKAIAAAISESDQHLRQSAADLLYWYTELVSSLPLQLRPQVYAVAAGLYADCGNEYMADAARYRGYITEGKFQREINNDFRSTAFALTQANSLADERGNKPPFDRVQSFIRIVRANIQRHQAQGEFLKGIETAEDGHAELTDGKYAEMDTATEETLLNAWIADLQSQLQRSDGQFERAADTTSKAIQQFRSTGADGPAQVAQARRYQLQAILKQLDLDFDAAGDLHEKAAAEIKEIDKQTSQFHQSQAKLCDIKQAILQKNITEATAKLADQERAEPVFSNLEVLIEVYHDYLQNDTTSVGAILKSIELPGEYPDRHISYNGNYPSVVMTVGSAQQLKGDPVPSDLMDRIVHAAIKHALSGGGVSRDWEETTELAEVDISSAWRQRIPTIILHAIEDVESLAQQPRDYAAPGMRLIAALEAYLRVLAEYYSRLEYGEDWNEQIVSRNDVTLGDLKKFFENRDTTNSIRGAAIVREELTEILPLRNNLDHGEGLSLDEASFEELLDRTFRIFQSTCYASPVIADIRSADPRLNLYNAELAWTQTPRNLDFKTDEQLDKGTTYYLPPDIEIETGFASVDGSRVTECVAKPSEKVKLK